MQGQLWEAGAVSVGTTAKPYISQAGMCRQPGCTKRARPRQGARYCDEHARGSNGAALPGHSGRTVVACRKCGKGFLRNHVPLQSETLRAFYEFCPHCRYESPLQRRTLSAHNVPAQLVRAWIAQGRDIACQICHRRLAKPCVDHSHRCCKGERSCGECVRGILCHACNTALGVIEATQDRINDFTSYLERSRL